MKNYFKPDDKTSKYFIDPKTAVSSGTPEKKPVLSYDDYKKSTNKVVIKRYVVKQD